VVLAANRIGTPRLLLNSRSARFPDGLVGRNLMFHPYAMVRGEFDQPLGGYRGPLGCTYETGLSRGFVRGYSFQVARGLSPIATALMATQTPSTFPRATSSGRISRFGWRAAGSLG